MAAGVPVPPAPATVAPRLLPHQLVARDGRSSYIKRVDTLAGPGAYVIPSSFKTMETNPQVRGIHKHHYGREFARQQRGMSLDATDTTPCEGEDDAEPEVALTKQERRDIFIARRERLRELLEQLDERRDWSECSDSLASPTLVTPFQSEPLPQSPSLSCTSNFDAFVAGYKQHGHSRRTSAASATRTESVRSPTSPCDFESAGFRTTTTVDETPRQRRGGATKEAASPATSPAPAPVTYRAYLATTSYSKRLARLNPPPGRRQSHHQSQHQRRQLSAGSAAGSSSSARPLHGATGLASPLG